MWVAYSPVKNYNFPFLGCLPLRKEFVTNNGYKENTFWYSFYDSVIIYDLYEEFLLCCSIFERYMFVFFGVLAENCEKVSHLEHLNI